GFGGEEDSFEDVVIVANDLCTLMIQTTLSVDFEEDINIKSHELMSIGKSIIIKEQKGIFCLGCKFRDNKFLGVHVREQQGCSRWVSTIKDFLSSLIVRVRDKHRGSKQVGFKQLDSGVERGVHEVHDEKCVWFEVKRQGAQKDSEVEVFQVSNDTTAVAQRQLEDKQPKKKTKTDCLSGPSKVFWAEDTTMSTYLVNRSQSSAIRFKTLVDMLGFFGWLASIKQGMLKLVKVKCIFLGYHESIVGNKLWRLDGVTSEIVLYKNMGFNESGEYKKTFIGSGVATVEGKAVTTTTTISGSMHQGLLVKAKGTVLGLEIIRDQSGNTLKVSQSRVRNEKLLQTLLNGHSTLSLKDSLSGDCVVKKN
nr:zinc finger, CCHC-type [Tanacetum cinerariifolium]